MLYLHTLCICIHISHNWTVMLHACSFVVVINSTLLRFCSGQWWQTYLLKPVCDDRCCDLCWRWSNNIILWKTTEQGHRNVTFRFLLRSSQCSPVPAATTPQPMPLESGLHGQLLSHSLSPPAESWNFFQPLKTQQQRLLFTHHCWADVFLGVRAETWHLSSVGSLLSSGLGQLYYCYLCSISNNYLCCWCFAEPGVVSDHSAVPLRFICRL